MKIMKVAPIQEYGDTAVLRFEDAPMPKNVTGRVRHDGW